MSGSTGRPYRFFDLPLSRWIVVMLIALLLLAPIFELVLASFTFDAAASGADRFANWRESFSDPRIVGATLNTISLSLGRQAISLLIGVFIAWLIARTNLPARGWIEVGFWIALFMPALPLVLAWILVFGMINAGLQAVFPTMDAALDIYSWWGIVWVHLVTSTIAVKVFLVVPAFKAIDSSLEEAARTSGASLWATFGQISLPLIIPTLLVVTIVGLVRSMQAFEVELVLGAPIDLEVYSTVIYRAMSQEPPLTGQATTLSIALLLAVAPLVYLQERMARRRRAGALSGRFSNRVQNLGRARWPLFFMVAGLLAVMTVVPMVLLMMATFMKVFGIFDLANPWTLDNWTAAFLRGDIVRALVNTLKLGFSAAAIGMILFTGLAYAALHWRGRARQVLDFVTWVPALVPGVILSLGLLLMFSGVPFLRPLYGTMTVLVVAILFSTITIGTQLTKGGLAQLGAELEEAGRACGASFFFRIRRIVLPLIAPTIAVVGLEIFATANAAVGIVSLLSTGVTEPLSLLQLNLLNAGKLESAAVVGIVIATLTIGSALLARSIATRTGVGRYAR